MPTARQRGARRESASSAAASGSSIRVRKSSVMNGAARGSGGTGVGSMRPRANTISHVDNATIGMLAAANSSSARHESVGLSPIPNHHPHTNGLPGVGGFNFRGMSTATGHHGNPHVLPKLDTNGLNISASLRTAPPYGGSGGEIDMESLWFGPGSTVNPAQLHFSNSPQPLAFETPTSPYHQGFSGMPTAHATLDDDGNFTWLDGLDNQMSFNNIHDRAIDGSSPSAISTGSHSGLSEVMVDGSTNPVVSSAMWPNPMMSQVPTTTGYSMDWSLPVYQDMFSSGQLSPKTLTTQIANNDQYFSSPSNTHNQTPTSMMYGLSNHCFHPPMIAKPETPSNSAASTSSSNRHSSVTSISTDSITDATRQALLASLSHTLQYNQSHVNTSQPQIINHPQISFGNKGDALPSTYDLQRYIAAYIEYFHPHLPFLHVPSFLMVQASSGGPLDIVQGGFANNKSSLILAMAAIGALYDYDIATSKELSEMAEMMTQHHLEDNRRLHGSAETSGSNTPLWLVQAMLLNVIYSHQCGDKITPGAASAYCASLVRLARAAELTTPLSEHQAEFENVKIEAEDIQMSGDGKISGCWNMSEASSRKGWLSWKVMEERKRTLYTVFTMSSILVSGHNHVQALTNSEIRLDLPCDEELWAADTFDTWNALGGAAAAEQRAVSFASALSYLLTANQRQQQQQPQFCASNSFDHLINLNLNDVALSESDLKPSTFGCLILINALHNYIWETKQRHKGRQWTAHETEAMHAHVEPALKAWQAAWVSNPHHSIQRPNPFGCGPLSADCVPLLDLAYVKLSVNLGRSREAFGPRDYNAATDETGQSTETIQHIDHSSNFNPNHAHSNTSPSTTNGNSPAINNTYFKVEYPESEFESTFEHHISFPGHERHLRKAAFYAANALIMSNKCGISFMDFSSRDLPIQSAICAFDAAQVLAEWVSVVQDRVGRFLGILGKDEIDFRQVPGIMLVEDEDCKLLGKINDFIDGVCDTLTDRTPNEVSAPAELRIEDYGYASKILLITALILKKAPVWPGEHPSLVYYLCLVS